MAIIRRFHPTSDVTSPWEGIAFTDPVDSDALHEKLLRAYPQCSGRSERKLAATIDFFMAELRQMKSKDPKSGAPDYFNELYALASPQSPAFSGRARGIYSRRESISSSLSRVSSTGLSASAERNVTHSNVPSTSYISKSAKSSTSHIGQHLIFSAVDGHTVKPKKKRKMTSEEKTAYKKTRIAGACSECKKMKSKVYELSFNSSGKISSDVHSAPMSWNVRKNSEARMTEGPI